jgi:hypothetical protein
MNLFVIADRGFEDVVEAVRAASPVEFAEDVLVPGGQSAVEHLLAISADRARSGRGPRP